MGMYIVRRTALGVELEKFWKILDEETDWQMKAVIDQAKAWEP